jgi:hypothetical protein
MKRNIIIIDLTMSVEDLRIICDNINMNLETLVQNKNAGFHKIWVNYISEGEMDLIAYTRVGSKKVEFIDAVINSYEVLQPVVKEEINDFLTVDDILDKISNKGIDSLSDKELKFLKENS